MNTFQARRPVVPAILALGMVAWACGGLVGGGASPTPSPPSPSSVSPTANGVPASLSAPTPSGRLTAETATGEPDNEGTGGGGEGLSIIHTNVVPAKGGGWRLVGEVVNESDVTFHSLSLDLEWFDLSGASLGKEIGYLLLSHIAPGKTAPFSHPVYDAGLQIGSFNATVGEYAYRRNFSPASLEVAHTFLSVDVYADFHCTGELVNNSGAPADISDLAATIVDKNGAIVSADAAWAFSHHLEPGDRTPFRITAPGVSGATPADYVCSFFVDAQRAEPLRTDDIAFVDQNGDGNTGNDIVYYVDTSNAAHLVGELINTGNTTLQTQLVAGLYDAEGNVLDADFTLPPVLLDPGQRIPYDFGVFVATQYNPDLRSQVNHFFVKLDPLKTYPGVPQVQLKVQHVSTTYADGKFIEAVRVTNHQATLVSHATVLARVTDPSGRLVGYGYTVTDPLGSGGSVNTTITVFIDPALDPQTLSVNALAFASKP